MEVLKTIAGHAADLCAIITLVTLFVRPVRNWLFGAEKAREGQRCLLRSEIVKIYYRNQKDKCLQEYEYKNMTQCYKAYKSLGGNSFIDHIYNEMQEWTVTY